MIHNDECNKINCLIVDCYYNHLECCHYCKDANARDLPIKMVVITQTGTCAMMRRAKY
jgi:hypothetical protein